MRRTAALVLLVVALGLIALGLVVDAEAAAYALAGSLVVGLVAVVDVDKLGQG